VLAPLLFTVIVPSSSNSFVASVIIPFHLAKQIFPILYIATNGKAPYTGCKKEDVTMKIRVLSLVLAVLLIFPGAAFAENGNPYDAYIAYWQELFGACTTDLLLQVKSVIDVELASRDDLNKEVFVPQGLYTIGIDIPAGTYTITATGELAMVSVYTSDDRMVTMHSMYENEAIGKIDLQFGQKINITGCTVVFSTYKGLGF
jgi:hypothetical protein